MNPTEDKAWAMLTTHEQNSLSLNLSHGLSSWEAGEILGISHYKYLEIKERSEKFFKLFIDYFNTIKLACLFHPESVAQEEFRDYIEACIEKRMTRGEASKYTGHGCFRVNTIQNRHIELNMNRLRTSHLESDKATHMLILEFDRWNNKRILPRKLQMPSAYKRRLNKRDKAYIKYLNKVKTSRVENTLSRFTYRPLKASVNRYFIALISNELFEDGYQVIAVKPDENTLEKLTKLYIYVFPEQSHADVFGYMVATYKERLTKAGDGQRFWPQYHSTINKAVNFKSINNIHFYAEDLERAYKTRLDIKGKSKKGARGAKRASPEFFY